MQDTQKQTIGNEQKLMGMSVSLIGLAMMTAKDMGSAADVADADSLHRDLKLYPRLTVTCPHAGDGVHVELVLCDPKTDEPVVAMYQATGYSRT